jgi:energy-coupling factor transporter ATP-binding protein EcfA2
MILDDNPAIEDLFGFSRFVEALTAVIHEIESTPFVMGIIGPWGCGKTTLMKQIERALDGEYKTIWFNPWKYDNKEAIWNAFIQSILNDMKKELESREDSATNELIERISSIGKKLAWYSFKVGANKLTGGIISNQFLDSLKEAFKSNEEHYEFINKFEHTFGKLIRDYCGDRKMIIFIDDLDRCIPENAITVLESIKLFLDDSNCVFVLGLEKEIVEKGIHYRYKKEIDFSGKDYLEKIIQLPFTIPAVSIDAIRDYIKSGKANQILPDERKEEFIDVIITGTGGNLRKIKRFINNFYLLKLLAGLSPKDWIGHGLLAKILILQMRYPKLYRKLNRSPDMLGSISAAILAKKKIDFKKYCEVNSDDSVANLSRFLTQTTKIEDLPERIKNFVTLSEITRTDDVPREYS